MKVLVTVVALLAFAAAEQVRYDNYKVVTVQIENEGQADVLNNIENYGFMYFDDGRSIVGSTIDIIVPPEKSSDFEVITSFMNMKTSLKIENIQKLIDEERPAGQTRAAVDWTAFNTLDEIYSWMDTMVSQHSELTTIIGGSTYEGRQIKGVRLARNSANPGIFIESNIHAREWVTSATATWLINELVTSTNPSVKYLADNFNWYIFPVTNPDGYYYSHVSERLWRKTRTTNSGSTCIGIDPNRNWDIFWQAGGSGASNNPCSDTFAGTAAFSAIETRSLSDYVKSIQSNLKIYLSFHAAAQMLLMPWGHTTTPSNNHADFMAIATAAMNALQARYGTVYTWGSIATTIYIATGGSSDWAYGAGITGLGYTYEFRSKNSGFVLPPGEIIPNSLEVLDSLIAMITKARELGYI